MDAMAHGIPIDAFSCGGDWSISEVREFFEQHPEFDGYLRGVQAQGRAITVGEMQQLKELADNSRAAADACRVYSGAYSDCSE